jgi:hypothetical protein
VLAPILIPSEPAVDCLRSVRAARLQPQERRKAQPRAPEQPPLQERLRVLPAMEQAQVQVQEQIQTPLELAVDCSRPVQATVRQTASAKNSYRVRCEPLKQKELPKVRARLL